MDRLQYSKQNNNLKSMKAVIFVVNLEIYKLNTFLVGVVFGACIYSVIALI